MHIAVSTCLTATGTRMPYVITLLAASWQRCDFRSYPRQLRLVLDLATQEECRAK